MPAVFFVAYILCVFVCLFKRHYRALVRKIILLLASVLTVVEAFVILFFSTRINSSIIALICETNATESSGFVTTYLLNWQFSIYVIGTLLFTLLLFFINSIDYKPLFETFKKYLNLYVFKLLLFVIIVFSVSIGVFRECRNLYWHKYNIDEIGRVRKYAFYSTTYLSSSCLYDAVRLYRMSFRDIPILVESLKNTEYDVCKYKSKNIVLIIGESFNKHHSSLYGYPLKTNPNLEDEENLYVMNNVITTERLTSIVMKNIFSFRNKDNAIYWAEKTLFPAIFKKAGYYCSLISNQEIEKGNFEDVYNMANDYLVHPDTKPYLWNTINSEKFEYDGQLIDEYAQRTVSDKQYTLTIFHLLGQHFAYKDRYPKDKGTFSVNDYEYRSELSHQQKEYVSQYDNAIRYGDEVVKSIIDLFRDDETIIIFFSDHGEEVYDYRDYMGRSHEAVITANVAKYVYNVPFFIWMSDKYMKVHPDIAESFVNSKDKPYMIDDIPHLLLDLAGIECDLYEPSRSFINEEYSYPKRLINESMHDYDCLMF